MTHASFDFPADARGYHLRRRRRAVLGRLGGAIRPVPAARRTRTSNPIDFRFWERFGDEIRDRARSHDQRAAGRRPPARLSEPRSTAAASTTRSPRSRPTRRRTPATAATATTTARRTSARPTCAGCAAQREVGRRHQPGAVRRQGRRRCSCGRCTPTGRPRSTRSTRPTPISRSAPSPRARCGVGPSTSPASASSMSWISDAHAKLPGDGRHRRLHRRRALRQGRREGVLDVFYSVNLCKAIWLAADYQLLWNPGYNADRPVRSTCSRAKVHVEF